MRRQVDHVDGITASGGKMSSGRLSAYGLELPEPIERAAVSFMQTGVDAFGGFFHVSMLREGIAVGMQGREYKHMHKLVTPAWVDRVTDALIKRERAAGHIEKQGFGRNTLWIWTNASEAAV